MVVPFITSNFVLCHGDLNCHLRGLDHRVMTDEHELMLRFQRRIQFGLTEIQKMARDIMILSSSFHRTLQ